MPPYLHLPWVWTAWTSYKQLFVEYGDPSWSFKPLQILVNEPFLSKDTDRAKVFTFSVPYKSCEPLYGSPRFILLFDGERFSFATLIKVWLEDSQSISFQCVCLYFLMTLCFMRIRTAVDFYYMPQYPKMPQKGFLRRETENGHFSQYANVTNLA